MKFALINGCNISLFVVFLFVFSFYIKDELHLSDNSKLYILVGRERNCLSTKRNQKHGARVTLGVQNFKIVLPFCMSHL